MDGFDAFLLVVGLVALGRWAARGLARRRLRRWQRWRHENGARGPTFRGYTNARCSNWNRWRRVGFKVWRGRK